MAYSYKCTRIDRNFQLCQYWNTSHKYFKVFGRFFSKVQSEFRLQLFMYTSRSILDIRPSPCQVADQSPPECHKLDGGYSLAIKVIGIRNISRKK